MTPIDILLSPLLNNFKLEDLIIKTKRNTIEIILESDQNMSHLRWVNVVEVEPYNIKDCFGNLLEAPYFDPPIGCSDNTMFYWDDTVVEEGYYFKDRWITTDKLIFQDAPFTPGLTENEFVQFTTCLFNTDLNLCETRINWWKDHTNKVYLGKPLTR